MPPVKTMFVVGLPCSGTALLANLLASAPQCLGISDPFLVHSALPHWRLKRFLHKFRRTARLQRLSLPHQDADADEFLAYLKTLASVNAHTSLIIRETFRTACHWANGEFLSTMAPENSMVAIVRHPFEVASASLQAFRRRHGIAGCLKRLWMPDMVRFSDEYELIEHIGINWFSFVHWCIHNATIIVSYEGLVADPSMHLKEICDACNLSYYKELLDWISKSRMGTSDGGNMTPQVGLAITSDVTQDDRLSPALQASILQTCGHAMRALGYIEPTPPDEST